MLDPRTEVGQGNQSGTGRMGTGQRMLFAEEVGREKKLKKTEQRRQLGRTSNDQMYNISVGISRGRVGHLWNKIICEVILVIINKNGEDLGAGDSCL
jgi:hypothetical protein